MSREYYEGLDKLHLRATLNALGIKSNKPVIAVISAKNETVLSNCELDIVTQKVCEGVSAAGGIAKVMYAPSFCDATVYGSEQAKYELLLRNTIANQVEMLASHRFFDGIVFVASNTVTVAGMLMGAIRLNLPCLFVSGGVMSPIVNNDGHNGYAYWYTAVGKIRAGKLKLEDATHIETTSPEFLGVDCELYEANSINCALEVLGMALEGNSTLLSNCASRKAMAYDSGKLMLDMVKNNLTPSKIISASSLTACVVFDLAMGGSPSTLLHLLAIAGEMKRKWNINTIDLEKIEQLAKKVPVLFCNEGNDGFIGAFSAAGGVYALLGELSRLGLANCDYLTYASKPMSTFLANSSVKNNAVIRTGLNPLLNTSRIRVLYGNLAEEGALLRFDGTTQSFVGPAKVYENEESLTYAILDREVKKGTVLVVRNEGPRSSPGMRQLIQPMALLKGLGLDKYVAIVTDGRISSDYDGFAVGHITPESGDGSMISLLQDGDVIEINALKSKLTMDVKAKEIAKRKPYINAAQSSSSNMLKLHAALVMPATNGCIDKDM